MTNTDTRKLLRELPLDDHARQILTDAGYTEHLDGSWRPAERAGQHWASPCCNRDRRAVIVYEIGQILCREHVGTPADDADSSDEDRDLVSKFLIDAADSIADEVVLQRVPVRERAQ